MHYSEQTEQPALISRKRRAHCLLSEFQSLVRSRFDEELDKLSTQLANDLWQNVLVDRAGQYGTMFIERLIECWPLIVKNKGTPLSVLLNEEFRLRSFDGGDFISYYFGDIANECLSSVKDVLNLNLSKWHTRCSTNIVAAIECLSVELTATWHAKYASQSVLLSQCPWTLSELKEEFYRWPIEADAQPKIGVYVVQEAFEDFLQNFVRDLTDGSNYPFPAGLRILSVVAMVLFPNLLIQYVEKQKQKYVLARLKSQKSQYAIILQEVFKKRTVDGIKGLKCFIEKRCRRIIRDTLAKSFERQNKLLDSFCSGKNKS